MKDMLVAEIMTILREKWRKFKQWWMRMRAFGKFMLLYWKVVHERYKPGGVFERDASARCNPMLLPGFTVIEEAEEDADVPKRQWCCWPVRIMPLFLYSLN